VWINAFKLTLLVLLIHSNCSAAEQCNYPIEKIHLKYKIKDIEGLTNVVKDYTLAIAPTSISCVFDTQTVPVELKDGPVSEETVKSEAFFLSRLCTTTWGEQLSVNFHNEDEFATFAFRDRSLSLVEIPVGELTRHTTKGGAGPFDNGSYSLIADCGSLRSGQWIHTQSKVNEWHYTIHREDGPVKRIFISVLNRSLLLGKPSKLNSGLKGLF